MQCLLYTINVDSLQQVLHSKVHRLQSSVFFTSAGKAIIYMEWPPKDKEEEVWLESRAHRKALRRSILSTGTADHHFPLQWLKCFGCLDRTSARGL